MWKFLPSPERSEGTLFPPSLLEQASDPYRPEQESDTDLCLVVVESAM